MKDSTKQFIATIIAESGAKYVGAKAVVGYISASHKRFAGMVKKDDAAKSPVGYLVMEWMERHPDSLSVSNGIWLRSTDSEAVKSKQILVRANSNGEPDYEHLLRDGGAAEKMMAGMGV